MRSSADRLSQLGVDQFLKGLLHQVTEQEPDLVTAKLRDELSQSGIMALGHRVSPFESTADELAEDSTVAPSDHGSTYTTRWDAYGLSARTVQYYHTILHRALGDAVRRGWVVRNVADYALVPAPKRKRRRAEEASWTANEVALFLAKTEQERLYPIWYVALMTGMRRGEILGLRWRDTDLERGRLRLVRQLRVVRHVPELSELKTDRSRRQVSIDPETAALLRRHRKAQLEERLMVGDGYRDGDLVFAQPDGDWYHPEAVSKVFDRRVVRYRLPRITFHDTRHTWATLALQAGVHPKVVSDRLGHSSVAFTLDVYSHAIQGLDDDAAIRVADLIHKGTHVQRRP